MVYDPRAMENAKKVLGSSVEYASSVEECLRGSECAIIVTEWDEFRRLRPEDFLRLMKEPAVVDGRRIYDAELFSSRLRFVAVGFGKTTR